MKYRVTIEECTEPTARIDDDSSWEQNALFTGNADKVARRLRMIADEISPPSAKAAPEPKQESEATRAGRKIGEAMAAKLFGGMFGMSEREVRELIEEGNEDKAADNPELQKLRDNVRRLKEQG